MVVPVSGGIDSALALAIAVDALGAGQVTAYNLPSQCNTDATRSIAERSKSPRRSLWHHSISSIDAEVQRTFEQHAHAITRSLTRENLRASAVC